MRLQIRAPSGCNTCPYREAEEGARGVVNPLDQNDSAYPFHRMDLVFAGFMFPLLSLDDSLFP